MVKLGQGQRNGMCQLPTGPDEPVEAVSPDHTHRLTLACALEGCVDGSDFKENQILALGVNQSRIFLQTRQMLFEESA
jgi:hypothetical protein